MRSLQNSRESYGQVTSESDVQKVRVWRVQNKIPVAMRFKKAYSGAGAVGGAIGFIIVVIALQLLQPGYDPIQQLMSELAMGPFGSLMTIAFFSFGMSLFSVHFGLRLLGAPRTPRMFLTAAAICLLGAGFFKLGDAPVLHVGLVASTFVLVVLAMYLLPKANPRFSSWSSRSVSSGLAAGTAFCVSLGGSIPQGISQRGGASCILIWLFWAGWRIIADRENISAEHQE